MKQSFSKLKRDDLEYTRVEGWIIDRLERIAAILRDQDLITSEAASEISGMHLQDFLEKYRRSQ